MKTLISILVLASFSTITVNDAGKTFTKDESGKMTFSVVYKETEAMNMAGGVPMKKKMKLGDDFSFDFSFSGENGKLEKQSTDEPDDKPKKISLSGASFSSSEDSTLPVDEFDECVFYFDQKKKVGLATVLEKDVLVEVAFAYQNLNLSKTDETMQILGYTAKKVMSEDEKVTVWYTDELEIHSPWQLEGIDGVILSYEDSQRTITATDLSFRQVDASLFELPERKLLTQFQYEDLKKEERDEMMKSLQEKLKESGLNISLDGAGIKIKKGGN